MKHNALFSVLDKKWNYMTTNQDGDVVVYTHKPFIEERFVRHHWKASQGVRMEVPSSLFKNYPTEGVKWRNSLICRRDA